MELSHPRRVLFQKESKASNKPSSQKAARCQNNPPSLTCHRRGFCLERWAGNNHPRIAKQSPDLKPCCNTEKRKRTRAVGKNELKHPSSSCCQLFSRSMGENPTPGGFTGYSESRTECSCIFWGCKRCFLPHSGSPGAPCLHRAGLHFVPGLE